METTRMSRLLVLAAVAVLTGGCSTTPAPAPAARASTSTPGVGDVEFERSWMIIYRAPLYPPSMTTEDMDRVRNEHLAFLREIDKSGQLHLAGPLADHLGGGVRGIIWLRYEAFQNFAEVRELAEEDPAVRAGMLEPFVYTFYRPSNYEADAEGDAGVDE